MALASRWRLRTAKYCYVRDSKDRNGHVMQYPERSWRTFVTGAKTGLFDLDRLELAIRDIIFTSLMLHHRFFASGKGRLLSCVDPDTTLARLDGLSLILTALVRFKPWRDKNLDRNAKVWDRADLDIWNHRQTSRTGAQPGNWCGTGTAGLFSFPATT